MKRYPILFIQSSRVLPLIYIDFVRKTNSFKRKTNKCDKQYRLFRKALMFTALLQSNFYGENGDARAVKSLSLMEI